MGGMAYYQDVLLELEDIRSMIKHNDPENVDLEKIRGFLGYVRSNLEVLSGLKRPDAFSLKNLEDGMVQITIRMIIPKEEAEDHVKKLWVDQE